MAERFNAAVLKTVEGATLPGVRISLSPPMSAPFETGLLFLITGRFELPGKGVRLQVKGGLEGRR